MRVLVIILLLSSMRINAQTYFGSASNPADNGSLGTNGVDITPPANMLAGDLCIVICQSRFTNDDVTLGNSGGQSWLRLDFFPNNTNMSCRIFWCRFGGNWDGLLSFTFGNTSSTTVTMHVFRPGNAANTWALDQAPATTQYAGGSAPCTVTQAGQTTVSDKVVALAVALSTDDNEYVKVSADWTMVSSNQFRNTSGNDQSHSVLYRILATAGTATTDASWRQSTLGCDIGAAAIVLFKEIPVTNRGIPLPLISN